jgi:glutamate N-acetyltransferase/amino-acid N-acetyltransferase
VKAGIKPSGGLDLAVLAADGPCAAAGTFTLNRVAAAPVHWDKALVPSEKIRAIVINAGNANAATGDLGLENAAKTAALAALRLGCDADQVLVASTGVIGHQLPMDRLGEGLGRAFDSLGSTPEDFHNASLAILTTDTRPKVISRRATIGGREITLFGMAKGAAMIGPRMATMLGFFLTDAPVTSTDLHHILFPAVDESFNCISVEGHTSTNDTVLILAQGNGQPSLSGADLAEFSQLLRESCMELARMIPADGEGATHLITIDVQGCRTREDARSIARSVADSPLVKTAIHGADPNWGRIVSAAGYAGIPFAETDLSLTLNGVPLYEAGAPLAFDAEAVSSSLKNERDVSIVLTFTHGDASIRFWTCDLTAEYVHLNADYTT